jgi:hypothetical protein
VLAGWPEDKGGCMKVYSVIDCPYYRVQKKKKVKKQLEPKESFDSILIKLLKTVTKK